MKIIVQVIDFELTIFLSEITNQIVLWEQDLSEEQRNNLLVDICFEWATNRNIVSKENFFRSFLEGVSSVKYMLEILKRNNISFLKEF